MNVWLSLYQLLESCNIAILAGVDKIQVIACTVLAARCSLKPVSTCLKILLQGHLFYCAPLLSQLHKNQLCEGNWCCHGKPFPVACHRSPSLTAPRSCRSSSGGSCSSRDTFPPWQTCRRTSHPYPSPST